MLTRIEVDEEVFGYLQSKAIAFVETPNDTLRRLLGIDDSTAPRSRPPASVRAKVRRSPKASLGRLIQAGILANGQTLYLHDYQGRRVPSATATIGGDGVFEGTNRRRLYSMSDLAQLLLKKEGYSSDSVRGPAHWFTEDGRSVAQLWADHLQRADSK